jgi:tetratricopeptide (TPR) repeat protein
MKPLDQDDRRHVEAAKGWCELHSFLEANEELEQVKPGNRAHPDVLEVRWQVYANLEKWDGALELASALMRMVPDKPEGYLYTASSLQELGRREEALQTLLAAVKRFPGDEIVLYDLACLCCILERVEEARKWLARAGERHPQNPADDGGLHRGVEHEQRQEEADPVNDHDGEVDPVGPRRSREHEAAAQQQEPPEPDHVRILVLQPRGLNFQDAGSTHAQHLARRRRLRLHLAGDGPRCQVATGGHRITRASDPAARVL